MQGSSHLLCATVIHANAPAPCVTPSLTTMCDNLQHLSVHTPLHTEILSHEISHSSGNTTSAKKGEFALQENPYICQNCLLIFYTPDLPQQLVFIQRSL